MLWSYLAGALNRSVAPWTFRLNFLVFVHFKDLITLSTIIIICSRVCKVIANFRSATMTKALIFIFLWISKLW